MSEINLIDNLIDNLKTARSIIGEILKYNTKTPYKHKLSHYTKWLTYLETSFDDNDKIYYNRNSMLSDFIKKDKPHYKGLIKRINELTNKIELSEVAKYKSELNDLKQKNNISDKEEIKSKKPIYEAEAIPKSLAAEGPRPKDDLGARIYDLRLCFGFGKAKAKTFAEEYNGSIELILEDWKKYVKENNDILMVNEMPIPPSYNKYQFDKLSDNEKYKIKADYFNKIIKEYKWLSKLTHDQLIGAKYFDDILQKIPRDEVEKSDKIMQIIANNMNPDLQLVCCGSYRRGCERSGDIDVLICHPDLKTKEDIASYFANDNNILMTLVNLLYKYGFIVEHISKNVVSKYMGMCRIPKDGYTINRRLDILFVPYNCFGPALLHFTGSGNFNVIIRNHALSKGYTLNQYGLFKYDKKTKKTGERMITTSEKDVFDILGLDYKKPEERNT